MVIPRPPCAVDVGLVGHAKLLHQHQPLKHAAVPLVARDRGGLTSSPWFQAVERRIYGKIEHVLKPLSFWGYHFCGFAPSNSGAKPGSDRLWDGGALRVFVCYSPRFFLFLPGASLRAVAKEIRRDGRVPSQTTSPSSSY